MFKKEFDSRIYTPRQFFTDLLYLIGHIPRIIRTSRNEKISKAFQEKIMTVSTAVTAVKFVSGFMLKELRQAVLAMKKLKTCLTYNLRQMHQILKFQH